LHKRDIVYNIISMNIYYSTQKQVILYNIPYFIFYSPQMNNMQYQCKKSFSFTLKINLRCFFIQALLQFQSYNNNFAMILTNN